MAIELSNKPGAKNNLKKNQGLRFTIGKAKVTNKDRIFFTEQLALLLETGNSLHASLEALSHHADNPAMKSMITGMMTDINEGNTFSHALSKYPEVFSSTFVNLVAAGEKGGFMEVIMEQLIEMEARRENLKATIKSALSYPAFLVFFSIAVIIFVLVVVFPKFSDMFIAIHDKLPITTKVLMTFSDILINHWLFVILAVLTVSLGAWYWITGGPGKAILDGFKLKFPVAQGIFIGIYFSQTFRILGLSLGNGVNIVSALSSCKDVIPNRYFRGLLDNVQTCVTEGAGIAAGFKDSDIVPQLVKQMITTGEETGNLPKVMSRIAQHYERELERQLESFSKMAEPLMLLIMGLVVGIIVSSLILPIFQLSRSAG